MPSRAQQVLLVLNGLAGGAAGVFAMVVPLGFQLIAGITLPASAAETSALLGAWGFSVAVLCLGTLRAQPGTIRLVFLTLIVAHALSIVAALMALRQFPSLLEAVGLAARLLMIILLAVYRPRPLAN